MIGSNGVVIRCINSNCNIIEKTYYFKIKVVNKGFEEFWIDIDGSGVSGTKFTFQVFCDKSVPATLIYPSTFQTKLY